MEINENCDKYLEILTEFVKDAHARYTSRKISFFSRDIPPDNTLTLGYVETQSHQDGCSSFVFEEENEKYETLEMQLKQIPKRNLSSIRRSKHYHAPITMPPKVPHGSKTRCKSIVEPRKLLTPYKIIGTEGEENAEFKHPLGIE